MDDDDDDDDDDDLDLSGLRLRKASKRGPMGRTFIHFNCI